MRSDQRGMTLIGFIIGLIVAGIFIYMGMILVPAYTEYQGVKKALDSVAAESNPNTVDPTPIIKALDRQFTVGYVETIQGKDVKIVRQKTGNLLTVDYEVRKAFVYNIDFAVKFKYQTPLGGKGGAPAGG
jgi:type II secretory pathway pseudopilin PulG